MLEFSERVHTSKRFWENYKCFIHNSQPPLNPKIANTCSGHAYPKKPASASSAHHNLQPKSFQLWMEETPNNHLIYIYIYYNPVKKWDDKLPTSTG